MDKNRSRWPVKPFWKTVQEAGALFGTITGVTRVRQKQAKYLALRLQLAGIVLSMIALEIAATGSERLALLHIDSVWRSIRQDKFLLERARKRAAKYACVSGMAQTK